MVFESTEDIDSQVVQFVSFKVSGEEYGIDILQVQEIIRIMYISSLPTSPDYVKGVLELRDQVIPVIDIRLRLKMPPVPYDHNTRIIVVYFDSITVGLVVDAVCEVNRIHRSEIEKPPSTTEREGGQFITGVSRLEHKLLILMDIKELMNVDGFTEFIENNEIFQQNKQ